MIMEYFIYKNVEQNNGKKEMYSYPYNKYNNNNDNENMIFVEKQSVPESVLLIMFVIYLILGIFSAKLSWNSNTIAGWSTGYKLIFSFFAFMFPCTYITAHLIFKMDLLQRVKGKSIKFSSY
jgi:hypothetical protein